MNQNMRTITTCSGIGDFLWIAQKLVTQEEKFNWVFPASKPRRAFQLQPILPNIIGAVDHQEKLSYDKIAMTQHNGPWKSTPESFVLAANSHLEQGLRIEAFLPDLKTSFLLPFITNPYDKEAAETVITGKWIGIYTSAYSMTRQWNGWGKDEWAKMVSMLLGIDPDYHFVIFGASYDIALVDDVFEILPENRRMKMIDEDLSLVIEVMRRLDMMIAFPSGMPILHELCGGKRTIMFYPPHLKKMQNAWADPERIHDGSYKGCQFCEPEKIFEWIKNNWL